MPITDASGVQRFVGQVAYVLYSFELRKFVAAILSPDGFKIDIVESGEQYQIDALHGTDSAAYFFLICVQRFQYQIQRARAEAARLAQLYPGDSVIVSDDYEDEDYAGCRLTYVGPGVLKDKYGNVCEVPANQYRKFGNGPRTPKSELTGTVAWELLCRIDLNNVDHTLVCCAIDELYDNGKLTDVDVTNLQHWGSSGYTNLLG